MKDCCGIYKIVCTATGEIYVGSAVRLRKRMNEHFRLLRGNKHGNRNLQKKYNELGKEYFMFIVLESILIKDIPYILEREQYWISELNPQYNVKRITLKKYASKIKIDHT